MVRKRKLKFRDKSFMEPFAFNRGRGVAVDKYWWGGLCFSR